MESSSEEEEGHTFVEVLSDKYNPENFPYGQGVVVMSSPPGSPVKSESVRQGRCLFVLENERNRMKAASPNCVCRPSVPAERTGVE